jgi:hypothetical protein
MDAHHYKTWDEAAGLPETAVPLPHLPQGLSIPETLPEPIRYDAERKLLLYRGFMCSASFAFLHALSADTAFLAALDTLYQATSYTWQKKKKSNSGIFRRLLGLG